MTRAEKLAVLMKLHEISLYVVELLFVLTYFWGVTQHLSTLFLIGLLGGILYIPVWCYVDNFLYKIKEEQSSK